MECPRASGVSLFMDLHIASHGSERHLVVIERAVEMSIGGDSWCGIGLAEEI